MHYTIYILSDPLHPTEYRYVGKTCKPLKVRLQNHISKARNDNTYRSCWIRKLLRENRKPIIVHTHVCLDEKSANKCEIYYIALLKYAGYKLVNLTNGGDGSLGYTPTLETIEKLRAAAIGRFIGENNPMYGKKHSPESIEKNRIAHTGKKHRPESIKKMIGRKCKPETIERMRVSHTGENNPMFGRSRTGKNGPFYGRKHKPESIEKMKAAKRH